MVFFPLNLRAYIMPENIVHPGSCATPVLMAPSVNEVRWRDLSATFLGPSHSLVEFDCRRPGIFPKAGNREKRAITWTSQGPALVMEPVEDPVMFHTRA